MFGVKQTNEQTNKRKNINTPQLSDNKANKIGKNEK